MNSEMITLPNGIRIVLEKVPFVRSISLGIWVRSGSRDEDITTNGISHFIEHMFFKGTENRTAKEIADDMDEVGGQINAFTTKEYTCYYTRTLDTHLDVALDVLADMYFNSKFEQTEIDKERNVILEEISMYEDTPDDLVHDILQYHVWKNNTLGYPILGTAESISSFQSATLRNHLQSHYLPENTLIAVAGNFVTTDIVKRIEKYFSGFERQKSSSSDKFSSEYRQCVVKKERDIEQVHLCIGFPGVSLGSEKAYDLIAINTIFGGGMSSRLFQSIREEHGLTYSIYSYNASFSDTGLFSIYAACNPGQVAGTYSLIIQEIEKLYTNRITEMQLRKTKEQLKSNLLLSLESTASRMNSIGRSQLMLNRVLTADELIAKIDAVNIDGIYSLMNEIFDMNRISLSAVGNISELDFEEMIRRGSGI